MTDALGARVVAWSTMSLVLAASAGILQTLAPAPWSPAWLGAYLVATTLPYVAAIVMLRAGATAAGAGVATATAALVLGHAVLGIFRNGFAGFSDATTFVTLAAGVLGAGLVPVQLLLFHAAYRTYRALPAGRAARPWIAGIASVLAWVALWAVLPGVLTGAWARERVMRAAEAAAEAALARVAACAAAGARADPARGFPATLAALGSDGRACLDPATARGGTEGHRVTYLPDLPDDRGAITRFVACAEPVDTRTGSVFTYVTDETGRVLRGVPSTVKDVESGAPLPCAAVWFVDGRPRRGVEHCLLAWAAAHPATGYPPTLAAGGLALAICLEATGARVRGPRGLGGSAGDLVYEPAAPGPDGVRRTFALAAPAPR